MAVTHCMKKNKNKARFLMSQFVLTQLGPCSHCPSLTIRWNPTKLAASSPLNPKCLPYRTFGFPVCVWARARTRVCVCMCVKMRWKLCCGNQVRDSERWKVSISVREIDGKRPCAQTPRPSGSPKRKLPTEFLNVILFYFIYFHVFYVILAKVQVDQRIATRS